jgi:hypothetical protein
MIEGGYWRRSVWDRGKVRTVHYGSGPAGVAVALMDAEAIEARDRERQERQRVDAEQWALLTKEAGRGRAVRRTLAVILEALGFIRYQRNPWRRCMRRRIELARRTDCGPPPTELQIRKLAEKVRRQEAGALAELAAMAEQWPEAVAAFTAADLAWAARVTLADRAAGKGGDIAVGIEAKLALLAEELGGRSPRPALRLAVEVACFCWAEHWQLAAVAAGNGVAAATPASSARRSAAQRRFLVSLKAVEQIKRIEEG